MLMTLSLASTRDGKKTFDFKPPADLQDLPGMEAKVRPTVYDCGRKICSKSSHRSEFDRLCLRGNRTCFQKYYGFSLTTTNALENKNCLTCFFCFLV